MESDGVAAELASRPVPVNPEESGKPRFGISVDERCLPPGEGRDGGVELELEDLEGAIDAKGGDLGSGDDSTGLENDVTDAGEVGLDAVLPEPTTLTVECEPDSLPCELSDNCDAGRDVTLKAGGGERSRMSVGTMGVVSVRS